MEHLFKDKRRRRKRKIKMTNQKIRKLIKKR